MMDDISFNMRAYKILEYAEILAKEFERISEAIPEMELVDKFFWTISNSIKDLELR